MGVYFFLDVTCTFLLHVGEQVLCCGSNLSSSSNLNAEQKEEYKMRWQRRVLLFRVLFGFLINISGFITMCVLHKETFIEGRAALGLFTIIIMFTVTSYIVIEFVVLLGTNIDYLICMVFYRVHEIEFDVFMFFYSQVLTNWKMTEFSTATTVLAMLDIVLNTCMLSRNCYDINSNDRRFVVTALLCGCWFPPFLTFFLFCCFFVTICGDIAATFEEKCCDASICVFESCLGFDDVMSSGDGGIQTPT